MPKKNGIVTGYAHLWPREIFDARDEIYKKRLLAKGLEFLTQGGVYVLYRDDEPFYIGKAQRLRKRLWQHANNPRDRYYHLWNFFSAFVVAPKTQAEIEGILIAAMPTANSASPKLPRERLSRAANRPAASDISLLPLLLTRSGLKRADGDCFPFTSTLKSKHSRDTKSTSR